MDIYERVRKGCAIKCPDNDGFEESCKKCRLRQLAEKGFRVELEVMELISDLKMEKEGGHDE